MFRTSAVLLCAALMVSAARPLIAEEPQSKTAASEAMPVDVAQLRAWIGQLGDDRFEVRERASRSLVEAGTAAIELLTAAVRSDDAEIRARAAGALSALHLSGSAEQILAAQAALEELAADKDHPLVSRAARGALLRRQRRLDKLESQMQEIGATLKRDERGLVIGMWLFGAEDHSLVPLLHSKHLPMVREWLAQVPECDDVRMEMTVNDAADLRHLAQIPHLKALMVGGDGDLGDDDVMKCFAGLTELESLKFWGRPTDKGLEHLAPLVNLRELRLGNDARIEGPGLAHLAGLTQLRQLNFSARHLKQPEALAHLARLEHLESLNLAGAPLEDDDLRHLAKLRRLKNLNLSETHITDAGLVYLEGLKDLEQLFLSHTRVTQRAVDRLKQKLPKLTMAQGLPDAVAPELVWAIWQKGGQASFNAEGIQEIDTGHGDKYSDADMALLAPLTTLRILKLDGHPITDRGLAQLSGLHNLHQLHLADTKITDAGLKHLAGLSKLRELDLEGTAVGDAGLANLVGDAPLSSLNLSRTRITDAGLAHLARLPQLRWIDLSGTSIGDAGIAHLVGLKKLQTLRLGGTAMTDAAVEYFVKFPALETLELSRTKLTPAGHARLKAALKTPSDNPFD